MNFDLQTLIVIVLVGWAAISIIRRVIRVVKGEQCAGSCASGGCGSSGTSGQNPPDQNMAVNGKVLPVVSLDVASSHSNSQRN